MKKTIAMVLLFLALFLSGCTTVSGGNYTVAAVGIEKANEDYKIFIETVVVNSEDNGRDIEKIVFEGSGATLKKASENAFKQSARALSFGHTAVIVLGDSVTESQTDDILDFCLKDLKTTVSVGVVRTENVKELLEKRSFSSVAVGYDIASLLETQHKEQNKDFANRLYQIKPLLSYEKFIELPYFTIVNDRVSFGG